LDARASWLGEKKDWLGEKKKENITKIEYEKNYVENPMCIDAKFLKMLNGIHIVLTLCHFI